MIMSTSFSNCLLCLFKFLFRKNLVANKNCDLILYIACLINQNIHTIKSLGTRILGIQILRNISQYPHNKMFYPYLQNCIKDNAPITIMYIYFIPHSKYR